MATRLYFHDATNSLANLPTAEQSSLTATVSVDGATVNRKMDIDIGVGPQVQKRAVTGTTAAPTLYFTRFVSDELGSSQTSIAANTWTYNFAIRESAAGANFPVTTSGATCAVCYVWRPSTQSVVGTIIDSATGTASIAEATTGITNRHTTFSGSSVASTQAGDVIVFEVWFNNAQAAGTSRNDDFFYDGTTVNTTAGTTVSNHASFLETPENIVWGPKTYTRAPSTDTVTVSESLGRSRTAGAGSPQNTKVGIITKDTTSGAHTQNFTNELGFSPQAIIFFTVNNTAAGTVANMHMNIGFTDGTNHFASSAWARDNFNGGTTSLQRNLDTRCIIVEDTANPSTTTLSEATCTFGNNGFDLVWTKANTTQNKIIYWAFGGGGFHDAAVQNYLHGGTGSRNYSTIGDGSMAFFVGSPIAITSASTGACLSFGVANGTNQWVITISGTSGFTTDSIRSQVTTDCIRGITGGGTSTLETDGAFSAFTSTGFTLNYSAAATADRFASLVVKGGLWDVGSFNQNTSNGTQQVNITTGRTPTNVMLGTFGNAATTSNVDQSRMSIGLMSSTVEASAWSAYLDAQTSATGADNDFSDTKVIRCLSQATGGGTLETEADFSSFQSGSFTINNTTTDATSREICYVAFTPETTGTNYTGTPSTDSVTVADASLDRIKSAARVPSTDSSTVLDSSLTRMLSAARAPSSDTLTIADVSTTKSATRLRLPSTDSSTITDSALTRMLSATRTPSTDVLTIGESRARVLSALRLPPSDSTTVADVSITKAFAYTRTGSDTIGVSDSSLSRLLSAIRVPALDTVTVTGETSTRMLSATRVPTLDTVATTEQAIGGKVYGRIPSTDSTTVVDSAITRLLSAVRSRSDDVISGESLIRILSALRVTSSDTTTVADAAIVRIRSLTRTLTADDTTVVDSSLTRMLQAFRAPTPEAVSPSDASLVRTLQAFRSPSVDTTTTNENITASQSQSILRTANDVIDITEGTPSRFLSAARVPSLDTVTVVDSSLVRMLQLVRVVTPDTIALSENISRALTTAGVFSRTASDTITIAEPSLIRLLSSVRSPTADISAVTDNRVRSVTRNRSTATDSISIADVSITRARSLLRLPTQDTMNIVETSLIRLLSLARGLSDNIAITEVQSEIAHSRALLETVNVTEPLLQRIVSASRSLNDIVNTSEAVFFSTYHKYVFDTVVVAEQLFSIRQSLTGAVTYAIPSEVRPLLGNLGAQKSDDQINLAIDAAYDEINTKTNRIPPNDWKDTDHNFGIVKKLARYIAAKEVAIGIKDFDTKPFDMEIEHLFNDLLTYDTTSDATQDIVGSSEDATFALNEGGIIWSTRYPNLRKTRGSENSTTINPDT